MEQENTNTPDKKRTLEELCQDITLRAEKVYLLSKKVKLVLLVIFGALAIFDIWNHSHGRIVNFGWLGWALVVVFFASYLINKQLIKGMKSAATPKQYLRLAKGVKWSAQFRNGLSAILVFLPLLMYENTSRLVFWIIMGLVFVLGFVAGGRDSAFNDDLHELEYRLDE